MIHVHTHLAAEPDFHAIAAITNHYIRHTPIHFASEDVSVDELLAAWRSHAGIYPWLVAEIEGRAIGYAKAGVYRARTAYRWTTETGIYLSPAHLGRGFGPPLYARLLATLRAQGFHAAIGGIALPNEPSVRLHERLGFVHCGTVPRAGRKFVRWHDVGFWHLALQPATATPAALRSPGEGYAASV